MTGGVEGGSGGAPEGGLVGVPGGGPEAGGSEPESVVALAPGSVGALVGFLGPGIEAELRVEVVALTTVQGRNEDILLVRLLSNDLNDR